MAIDQIEEIKQKLDIVDLVGSYVPLAKSGKNYKALCPFHSEKTPSFMVSPQLQIFKCFGCGDGGDAIAFYSKMEGVPFGEALKQMAKRAGVKLVGQRESPEEQLREKIYQINRLASDFFHYLLVNHRIGEEARKFLKGRGVSKESIDTFNLGYAPDSWDSLGRFILSKNYTLTEFLQSGLGVRKEGGRGYFDFFRGRVIFPLRSPSGKVAGFSGRILEVGGPKDVPTETSGLALDQKGPKYINTVDTPAFEKRRYLFNFDLAKQEIKKLRQAILVEGEIDAIALYEKGIKNVVATKGTALSPEQVSPLARFAQRVVICFDRDSAGLEATKKGLLLAQSIGLEVRAALLPEGQDPDEAVRENVSSFKKLITEAPPIFDFYLSSALARFDTKTPEGKKQISHELLPVLKSLANEVEKAAYLARLSDKISVSEEVLWRQLGKEEPIANPAPTPAGRGSGRSVGVTQSPKKEAYLFAVLFALPKERVGAAVKKLSQESLTDPALKEIFSILKGYLKMVKRFNLEKFSLKVPESLRPIFTEVTLAPLPKEFTGSELEEEFAKALAALQKDQLARQRRVLIAQVGEAEKAGKHSEVRRLQKELLGLTKGSGL